MMQKIYPWSTFFGLSLLAVTVMALLTSTVIEAWAYHSIGGVMSVIVFIGAGIAILNEGKQIFHQAAPETNRVSAVLQGLSVVSGSLLAYALSHDLSLGAVVAASLVAILAYLIAPSYSVPAYCGAFVGMTSNLLLFSYVEVGLAGLIAGIVYVLTRHVFNGIGGKLGTIALIGTALTGMSLGREFLLLPIADWETNTLIILTAMLGAPLTFFLNIHQKHGPVMASAFVGLIAGLILPNIFPEIGQTLSVVAICASFAGMTSGERCPAFWTMLITALFTGVVFVYSTPLLGGAGGKLGTIAFGAVLSSCGYARLRQWVLGKQRLPKG